MQKTDWELFYENTKKWRERFLFEKNKELAAILTDSNYEATEAFFKADTYQEQLKDTLSGCFDGNTKETLGMSLILMARCGMIGTDDVTIFSQEMQSNLSAFLK
jgi:hypothetical protein